VRIAELLLVSPLSIGRAGFSLFLTFPPGIAKNIRANNVFSLLFCFGNICLLGFFLFNRGRAFPLLSRLLLCEGVFS